MHLDKNILLLREESQGVTQSRDCPKKTVKQTFPGFDDQPCANVFFFSSWLILPEVFLQYLIIEVVHIKFIFMTSLKI